MCDPTGGILTTALIIGSAAVSAYGSYQQGQAAKKAGAYNNAVAEQNGITADALAADATARGKIAEDNQRRQTASLIGRQQAVLAAKGIDIGSGTPLDILSQSAEYGEMDAQTIRHNASLESLQYTNQARNIRGQGAMDLVSGKNAATAANYQAAGTLLGGASKAGSYWHEYGGTN